MGLGIKLSVQTVQPLIVIYRRGNFMYNRAGCTSIYRSLSNPFKSLICPSFFLSVLHSVCIAAVHYVFLHTVLYIFIYLSAYDSKFISSSFACLLNKSFATVCAMTFKQFIKIRWKSYFAIWELSPSQWK